MSTGIIGIGITGLQAAQMGLLTSEHNISNASTPGYNRQRIVQASNVPLMTGAGALGQGTHVETVQRMYSDFLSGQVNSSQTNVSELESYYAEVSQIDNMLADPNSGLSPALQDFFRGVQQVAATPSSMSARQSMISAGQSMVTRFQGIEDRLTQIADGVNSQITTTVGTINSYAKEIADLNGRIIVAQSGVGQPPNDLLDQRDQIVSELNKLIKVRTSANSDGSYNVFIGTGQQLVVGVNATTMTAAASSADPSRIAVGLQNAGSNQELPEFVINGGQLGGLVRFRTESLDPAFNEMGRVASSLALTFNAQFALGQDLLGQSQGNPAGYTPTFFDLKNMQPTAIKNASNTGNAAITAAFVSPPPVAGVYTLTNTAGNYTLTRQSDGQVWPVPPATAATLAALQATVPAAEGVDVTNATVAAGASSSIYSSAANTSNFLTNLTTSDYRLSYDGTNYTLTRLTDNKKWSNASVNGLSATVSASEGFTLNMTSGAMTANVDTFLIQPTRSASRNIAMNAAVTADPRLITAGLPFKTSAAVSNTGSAVISNGQTLLGYTASSMPAAGVTVTYNGGNLTFAGLPANANLSVTPPGGTTTVYSGPTIPYVSGAKIEFSGIAFDISGTPAANDTFTLAPNAAGVSDGRNALNLGQLQVKNTIAGGAASFQVAYSQFVSSTGNQTHATQVTRDAQQALLEQASASKEALSGVNLDEEAANLLRYQQVYQAAARMIDIGTKLFDSVLAIRS
ncbi:MAG TPA: flagellar hook-associated protein FlgK [Rhodocyclaceae bacterium]|nr:flagellar hook-associated protein FlgK [Rhodocyclaceae bacterium]